MKKFLLSLILLLTALVAIPLPVSAGDSEVILLRTENSKTYYLGNNQYEYVAYTGAIHYKDNYNDPNEQWKDIDLMNVGGKITKAPYELTIYENKQISFYDKKTGSTATISLQSIGGKVFNNTKSSFTDGKVSWKDIAKDTDLVVTPFNEGVRITRVLKSTDAPAEATFDILQTGTGITVTSQARYSDTGEPIAVTSSIKDGKLTESIDKSKITKYPIEIDPTLTIQPSGKDNFIYAAGADTNRGTETYLVLNPSGDVDKILVEFPITWGTSIPAGATLTAATLSLYNYTTNAVGRTYTVCRLLRLDWNEIQSTWNSYKTGSTWTTAGCSSDGNDYTSVDSASAVVAAHPVWMDWNVLAQVQTAQTGNLQIAFRIHDNTGIADKITYFRSKEYAVDATKCPKLVIDYTPIVAPTVTTRPASNITVEAARLNGYLDADGGATCQTRWGWGTVNQGDNITAYNGPGSPSAYAGAYVTGDHPYLDITGLSSNTTYYFNVQALNSAGTDTGTVANFTTSIAFAAPINLIATPTSSEVDLSWIKGAGTSTTVVRGRTGTYPTGSADGDLIYNGTASTAIDSGRTPGETRYYRAWGYAVAFGYTTGFAQDMATVLAASTSTGLALPAVPTPTRWFTAPNYMTMISNPLYDPINTFADAFSMPRGTFWLTLVVGMAVIFGMFILIFARSLLGALIAVLVILGYGYAQELVPLWLIGLYLLVGGSLAATQMKSG